VLFLRKACTLKNEKKHTQTSWRGASKSSSAQIKKSEPFTNAQLSSLKGFEEVLNYTFNDKEVLLEALTHDNSIRIMNYQRLEVIGGAALGKLSNFFVVMN
jgi:hypothetical protein